MNAMAAANMQLQQQLANAQQPVEVEDTEEVVITDPNMLRVLYSSRLVRTDCLHKKK